MIKPGLGKRVKAIRLRRAMSVEMLAELVGVSHVAILKYENEKMRPNWDNLQAIARVLKVSEVYLITGTATKISPIDSLDYYYKMLRLMTNAAEVKKLERMLKRFLAATIRSN